MEIVALGILILTAGLAYTAVNGYRSASRESAEPARGYQAGPGGTAERLAGLLSAWTGQKCRVHPYSSRPRDPIVENEEVTGLRLTVDGLCGSGQARLHRVHHARHHERGSGIEQHDVALRPAFAG